MSSTYVPQTHLTGGLGRRADRRGLHRPGTPSCLTSEYSPQRRGYIYIYIYMYRYIYIYDNSNNDN